jgi:hypothetical protein
VGQGQAGEEGGLKCNSERAILESFRWRYASNPYQLSLIHPQLKTGSANQRQPFSPRSDSSQPKIKNGNRNTNGTRNSKVV